MLEPQIVELINHAFVTVTVIGGVLIALNVAILVALLGGRHA